jgi:hypothetical protein
MKIHTSLAASLLAATMLSPLALAQVAPSEKPVAPAAAVPTAGSPAAPAIAAPVAQAPVYRPTSLVADASVPRTADGRPDLQNAVWAANYFGMLEAQPMMLPPELTLPEDKAKAAFDKMMMMMSNSPQMKAMLDADPEATELFRNFQGFPVVRGERRTRLVVLPADGKIPYSPEARKKATEPSLIKSDNPEDRSLGERCLSMGGEAPLAFISPMHPRQMVQTRDHIVINTEYGDEARIIRFAGEHRSPLVYSQMGDGIAHWEGDTLVIETTGFAANNLKRFTFPASLLMTQSSKVIERYTRISKDELIYQFTIEDPTLYTAPWMAEYSLFRAGFRMYPSGCHEGNYSLGNILAGQRTIDARRRAAFKPNDVNGDNKLDMAEFTKLMKSTGATGALEGPFNRRDVDKDGFITAQELDAEVKL